MNDPNEAKIRQIGTGRGFSEPGRRDLHLHTPYCRHAAGPMEAYVEAALRAGLEEAGFLEHAEAGIEYAHRAWLTPEELDRYWGEAGELKAKYHGRIRVTAGLELGYNPEAVPALQDVAGRHPWDRIGLSFHFLRDETAGCHLNLSSSKDPNQRFLLALDPAAVHERYYRTLLESLNHFRPAFLCHLDVIRRNLPDLGTHPSVWPLIQELLKRMCRLDVGLEINTAGYRYTGDLYPAAPVRREALRLGVRLVLNSDSHHPDQVGSGFSRAIEDLAGMAENLEPRQALKFI